MNFIITIGSLYHRLLIKLLSGFKDLEKNEGVFSAGLNRMATAVANFGPAFSSAFMDTGSIFTAFGAGLQKTWSMMSSFSQAMLGIGAVIGVVTLAGNAVEKLRQNAEDSLESWNDSADSVENYESRIEELRTSLDSGTLSDGEAYEAKSELLSIQESLVEAYGSEAEALDLVNGKYEDQIGLIDQMSATEAQETLKDNNGQIDNAKNAIEGFYRELGRVYGEENREAINEIIEPFGDDFQWTEILGGGLLAFTGTAKDAQEELQTLKDGIVDLQDKSNDDNLFSSLYKGTDKALGDANDLVEQYGTIYDDALRAEVMADTGLYGAKYTDDGKGRRASYWMQEYANAINDYNDALASGSEEEIREAQENYRNTSDIIEDLVTGARKWFGEDEGMAAFLDQLGFIADYLDEDKDAAFNFFDALRGFDVEEGTYEEQLAKYGDYISRYNMTADEFKNIVVSNRADGLNTAFTRIADYAEEKLGIDLDQLADDLVEYNMLSGEIKNAAESEPLSFSSLMFEGGEASEFSKDVDTFQSSIDELNSARDSIQEAEISGEHIDITDLLQEFDGLSQYTDDLERGISELSIGKMETIADEYNENIKSISDEYKDNVKSITNDKGLAEYEEAYATEMRAANKSYMDAVAGVDMSAYDFTDYRNDIIDNVLTNMDESAMRFDEDNLSYEQRILDYENNVRGLIDSVIGEYGDTELVREILVKLSLDADFGNWDEEELFDNMDYMLDEAEYKYSGTLTGTLMNGLGDETKFAKTVDKYESDIEGLNDLMYQVRTGENIDLSDMLTQFPELEDYLGNLEEGISQLSYDKIMNLGDEFSNAIAKSLEDETMTPEQAEAVTDMFQNWVSSADLSGLDWSGFFDSLKGSPFENMSDYIQDLYGDDALTAEVMFKIIQDPNFGSWSDEEILEHFQDQYELTLSVRAETSGLDQLSNYLDLIQTNADRIQNEMDRNDISGRRNGEQMYRDLINNGNLQIKNLEGQLALWKQIAAAANPLSSDYADAQSQIQSIESDINSVLSNQQEWNAAAEALKYEAGDLLSEYSDATSTRNGGDSYSEILSALDATNELVEEGKWGVDEAQAGLKLASAAGIADITNWEQNYAHMQRYFTEDATGISNALSDLTEATNSAGEALATYDEATGDWLVNISNPQDLEEAAQAWGINTEAAYALFSTLSDYGFTTTYLESEADGVYQLGQAYADLAQEEYKLNQMRKDSDKYSAEEMQAQQDVVDGAKQTVQDVQSALGSLDESYIEENQEMAYGQLLSMLNGLPEAAEAGSGTMSAYLDGMKQFADEHGLDTSDLFVTDSNGNLLLSKDGYEAMAASYGEFAEEMTLNAEDTGSKFGNALVNSMGETVDEEGTTIQDMAQSIADTFSSDELGQIEFDTGQYTEGVEEAEMAVDGLLTALGLTQAEGEQAVEFLQALQEGDWETALDIVTNAEEVEGELEDYFYDEEIEAKVKPKVEEALGEYTPEELLGIEDDEEFAATVGIDYDSDGAQQEINEARREIEGEEIQQKINTVVENNEEIESAEDLLNLSPEELEVEFEPVLDGTGLEMSDIESYLGYEEPEIPVTVKMDDAQFEQLTTPEEQEIPVTFKVDGDAAGEIQSALDAVDATVTAHIEFENEGTDLMTGVTETGEISVPGVVNFEVGEMPEGEEITATGIVNYQVGEVPESIDATATGTVNYEVGTTPTSVDAKATGTIDYKAGSVENPTEAAEGIINYTLGEVAIPEGQTASGVINYTLGNVAEPSGKTVTGTINYNLGSVAQPSSVDYSVGSAPSTVDNATGLVDYSVGDYPATVPDAQGVANYILGSYPTTVPSVTSTANFVLGSYPTSVPSVTQTVFQNVVSSGGTASSHDSSAYWSEHGSVLGTAHASGTVPNMNAYSGGRWLNWSLLQNEDALVNETGKPESIVRDGKWQLIKGGAHVESLKRGDIVLLNAHLSGNRWMYSI